MNTIDLNCDMGESFGPWKMGRDAELMNHVSSVNIACGFHAGDPSTIRKTIESAIAKNVAIGAHPSFPDLQGFGRRNMTLPAGEIYDIVLYQVAAMKGVCEALGVTLHHVKPHGALYNQAAENDEMSGAIAAAVHSIDQKLIVYGLSGSKLISEAEKRGLRTASEVFADRTYQADGSLTPRTQPNALIETSGTSIRQALQMVKAGTVTSMTGEAVEVHADTLCLHGDSDHALEFAIALRQAFSENGIDVKSL